MWSWFTERVSAALEPLEREAVRGDLAELRVTGVRALCEVSGLVFRRQCSMWADWRPWFALLSIAVPMGTLLSYISRWWSDGSAIYLWLYVNNWTWYYLKSPGARHDLAMFATTLLLQCLALCVWAWSSGYALAFVSRRTTLMTGLFLSGSVAFAALGTMPARNPFNDAVYSVAFYGVVLPWLFRVGLVLFPAWWGMRRGARAQPLSLHTALLLAGVVLLLTAGTIAPFVRGLAGVYRLVPFLVLWPIVCVVVNAWHCRPASHRVISN